MRVSTFTNKPWFGLGPTEPTLVITSGASADGDESNSGCENETISGVE
jgi:hypothetical protein